MKGLHKGENMVTYLPLMRLQNDKERIVDSFILGNTAAFNLKLQSSRNM